jgi:hypothetical protein
MEMAHGSIAAAPAIARKAGEHSAPPAFLAMVANPRV